MTTPPPLEGGGGGGGVGRCGGWEQRGVATPPPPPPPPSRGGGVVVILPPSRERLDKTIKKRGQLLLDLRLDLQIGPYRVQNRRLARLQLAQQLRLERPDATDLDLVQIPSHAGENRRHLFLHRHRPV